MKLAKNFTLKELLELLHDIDSTREKMFEADPNLGRSLTNCQGMESMCAQYGKLHDKKKASTIRTTLDKFLQRNKTLKSLMF